MRLNEFAIDSRFSKTEWMPLLDAIKILKHYGATPEKYMGHDMFPYYDREGNRKYLEDITWNADNSKNVRVSLVNAAVRELRAQQQDVAEGQPKEKEADYGDDYQDMVSRVKKLAGMGPLKTVYDPQKRVYKNVPVAVQPAQQPKKER